MSPHIRLELYADIERIEIINCMVYPNGVFNKFSTKIRKPITSILDLMGTLKKLKRRRGGGGLLTPGPDGSLGPCGISCKKLAQQSDR